MPGHLLGAGNAKFSLSALSYFWLSPFKRVCISEGQQNEVFNHQRALFLKLQMLQECVGREGDKCSKWDSELIKFGG